MQGGALTIEATVRQDFERAVVGDINITSDKDRQYNCIAWAMGEHLEFWWPDSDGHWPEGIERVESVDAFVAAFATKGFAPCTDSHFEQGKEKVALFTLNSKPTHAAFLLPSGDWASKLGRGHDVHHRSLNCVSGKEYGEATHFFSRDLPIAPRPAMPNTEFAFALKYDFTNQQVVKASLKKPASKLSSGKRKK